MIANRVTAVFESERAIEAALDELRRLGVREAQMSVLQRRPAGGGGGMADPEVRTDRANGLAFWCIEVPSAPRVFGLATLPVPGLEAYLAGGALAGAIGAIGASAVGTVGAGQSLAHALDRTGYPPEAAHFYAKAIEGGAVFLTVDTTYSPITMADVRAVYGRHGGLSAPASA